MLVSNSDSMQILAVGLKRAMGTIEGIPRGEETDDSLIGLAFDDERAVQAEYELDDGF